MRVRLLERLLLAHKGLFVLGLLSALAILASATHKWGG